MSQQILMVTSDDLQQMAISAAHIAVEELEKRKNANRIYCINQVAKLLHKNHRTIQKLCSEGFIKTTADGKISQAALDDYLAIA
jgi:acyl-CoA reductase-like NAD-dependent aldehyde dehydrogenase